MMEKSAYAKGHFIFCLGGCPFLNLLTKDGMDYIENAELLEKLDLVVDGKLKGILKAGDVEFRKIFPSCHYQTAMVV